MSSEKSGELPWYKRIGHLAGGSRSATDTDGMGYDVTDLKEETLRWIFSIFGAVLVYLVVANIVYAFYHPDIDHLKDVAEKILTEPGKALPEPMEALLFRLSIIVILPCLLGFYRLSLKWQSIKTLAQKRGFLFISIASVVAIMLLVYFDFAMENRADFGSSPDNEAVACTNFSGYFNGFFIGSYLWVYALIVMPLLAGLFFIAFKKLHWETSKTFRVVTFIIGYAVTGGVLAEIIAMNIFAFPYGLNNQVDFNAVYYSMTQVHAGTPMLVDGFTNTYGLYPHFLNLLFHFTGLNVLKFSVVMSLLSGLAFVLNFYSVKKFIHNPVLLFSGFATLLFFSYLERKLSSEFDSNFALFPIRYIIPSVLVFLATVYLFKPSRWLYWLTLLVMGFFILWNPELGIVGYISLLLFLIYNDFYTADGKPGWRKMAGHLLAGILVLPVVFYSYKLLIFLFYGSSPDLSMLWVPMKVFSEIGFGLLPMALVHPWNLIALILVMGFTYSIMKWSKKTITPKASMVFLLSLIGLGYLFYFQGRSHSINLSVSSGFCILLLTVLGDELWLTIRTRSVLALNAVFVIFLFWVSFSFIELVYNTDKIVNQVYGEDVKSLYGNQKIFLESNREFLVNNSAEHEKILVLTVSRYQSLYFDENNRRSAFNPGLSDLFLNANMDRLRDVIRDSSFKVFIEPQLFNYSYAQTTIATVAAVDELTAAGKTMALLTKRKHLLPAATFFNSAVPLIVHRKYTDDTAGIRSRVNDASGIGRVTLNPEFSVQLLFFSTFQIYPFAALAGNLQDGKGFVIGNEFNTMNYYCVVNDNSFKFPVPENQWVHLAINGFRDHVAVYVNGSFAGGNQLPGPVKQSDIPFCIGNLGELHYFTGGISEVAVQNNSLDTNQIRKTWEEIRQVINK